MNIHFHFYQPFQIFPSKSRNRASIKSLGIQMLKVVPGVMSMNSLHSSQTETITLNMIIKRFLWCSIKSQPKVITDFVFNLSFAITQNCTFLNLKIISSYIPLVVYNIQLILTKIARC